MISMAPGGARAPHQRKTHGGGREDDEADLEHAHAAEHVADAAGRHDQGGRDQAVAHEDPQQVGEVARVERAQVDAAEDGRQRDQQARGVDHGHEHAERRAGEHDPLVGERVRVRARSTCSGGLPTGAVRRCHVVTTVEVFTSGCGVARAGAAPARRSRERAGRGPAPRYRRRQGRRATLEALPASLAELAQQLLAARRDRKQDAPAVGRVGGALHVAAAHELIDEQAGRGLADRRARGRPRRRRCPSCAPRRREP